jgi:FkbM family methyltransferase
MALSEPLVILPRQFRRSLARLRRSTCEKLGVARYSRPSLNGLDYKLERYLDLDRGFFVEAGANDGYAQSNTYYFEKFRGWTGLLIEPVPELAAECRKNRRGPVVEAALVAVDEPGAKVELHYAGLMSTVAGALGDAEATAGHVRDGLAVQKLSETRCLRVPARTLSAVLDEARIAQPIDLLSLDVEGAELAALSGLDFTRHAPRYICVETRDRAAMEALLSDRYMEEAVLYDSGAYGDLLFRHR